MRIDFSLQTMNQRFYVKPQPEHSFPADDLCIHDRPDATDRLVEIVVHNDVLVLVHCLKLVQS